MDTNNKNNLNERVRFVDGYGAFEIHAFKKVDREPYRYNNLTWENNKIDRDLYFDQADQTVFDREPYDYSKKSIKAEP